MLDFLALDLGERLESEVDIGRIVHVEDLHHAAGALIEMILLPREEGCLLLLLFAQRGLEDDPAEPSALRHSHLGNTLLLAIIELTEECFLDLIKVLDVHSLFLFLDLN